MPRDATNDTDNTARNRRGPRAGKPRAGAGQSQSLGRGLALLEQLANAGHGLTLSDLAQQVGLAPSTTHRLLGTLESCGFVQLDEELGHWRVGARAFIVGSAFLDNRDFTTQARPIMRQLMEEVGETINLAVLDHDEVVIISQVECREMMRMVAKLGSRAPLHASGVGKALLAALPEARLNRLLAQRPLHRLTDNTLTDETALRQALITIRQAGHAVDDEEHAVGLRCLAATLHDQYTEPLGAISLSGPLARLPTERMVQLGERVIHAAAAITAALGGRLPGWWRH